MGAIWDAIVTNNQKLNDCPRHKFSADLPPPAERFGAKLKCDRCGGDMRLLDINQYVRGYIAGGGNGNDILPGWNLTG